MLLGIVETNTPFLSTVQSPLKPEVFAKDTIFPRLLISEIRMYLTVDEYVYISLPLQKKLLLN